MVTMIGLFAEIERDLISERTREALQARKANGVVLGRREGSLSETELDKHRDEIQDMISKGVKQKFIAKTLKVSPQRLSYFIKSRGIKQEE